MSEITISREMAAALSQKALISPVAPAGSENTQREWTKLRKASILAQLLPSNPSQVETEIVVDAIKKVTE